MRSVFTIATPLPPTVRRETAITMLHDHGKMIELNPLVIDYKKCRPPKDATADEFHCIWYEVTDKMSYLPGVSGTLKFNVCFNDIPNGVQTHVYAPMGLDIQEKWSVGGNLPGEPREPREIGVNVPRDCLYIREDVNMDVSRLFTSFVKTKLNKAHGTLVQRLLKKGEIIEDINYQSALSDTMSQSDGSSVRNYPMSPTIPQHAQMPQMPQRSSSNPYRMSVMSGMSGYDQKGMIPPPIYPAPHEGVYQPQEPVPYSNAAYPPAPYTPPVGKSFIAELPAHVPPTSSGQPSPQIAELYSPGKPPTGGMTHGTPPLPPKV